MPSSTGVDSTNNTFLPRAGTMAGISSLLTSRSRVIISPSGRVANASNAGHGNRLSTTPITTEPYAPNSNNR